MCAIFDQFQTMRLGHRRQQVHAAGATGEMHWQQGLRTRCDGRLDSTRIDVQRHRIDVRQNRCGTGVDDGVLVAQKVIGVVMTSSPGCTPDASKERCSAAVHEFSATACGLPLYCAMACSKRAVCGPVPNQPLFIVETTASISASSMAGAPNTRKRSLLRTGLKSVILVRRILKRKQIYFRVEG